MKDYIKQLYNDDCGFASLKMLLASIYKNDDYLYVNNPKEKGSYSLFELVNIASSYGLTLIGYQISDLKEVTYPFIALLKMEGRMHFVVVDKRKDDILFYRDPDKKKRKMKIEEFNQYFSSYALLISSFKENNKPKIGITKFPKKSVILGLILNLTLILVFIFFYEPNPFLYIILFSLTFIIQSVIKFAKMRLLKKGIERYLNKAKITKEDYQQFVLTYQERINIPFAFMEKILISSLLILVFFKEHLNYLNLALIIGCLLLKRLSQLFYKKKEQSLSKEEDELFNSEKTKRKGKIALFFKNLNFFIFIKSLVSWIIYVIMALITILILFLQKDTSISHFLVNFGASLIAFSSLDNALDLFNELRKWRFSMLKIQNAFHLEE